MPPLPKPAPMPRASGHRPRRPQLRAQALALLALGPILAACGGSSAPSPGKVDATPPAGQGVAVGEPNPSGPGDKDAREAIQNAIRAQLDQRAYKIDQTQVTANGAVISELTYVAPDRYQMRMRLPLGGSLQGESGETQGAEQQFIVIGDRTWIFQNGEWVSSEAMKSIAKSITTALQQQYGDWEKGITDIQEAGTEVLGNVPTHIYAYASVQKSGDQNVDSQVKLWIRDSDHLPVKLVVAGAFGGYSSETTQEITYDDGLKIEPPTK